MVTWDGSTARDHSQPSTALRLPFLPWNQPSTFLVRPGLRRCNREDRSGLLSKLHVRPCEQPWPLRGVDPEPGIFLLCNFRQITSLNFSFLIILLPSG